jgi:hypothetical protein
MSGGRSRRTRPTVRTSNRRMQSRAERVPSARWLQPSQWRVREVGDAKANRRGREALVAARSRKLEKGETRSGINGSKYMLS